MTSKPPVLTREPVRLPVWVALLLSALLAGLTAYSQSSDPLAAVIGALAVVVPGGAAVEVSRGRAWSQESVETVVREAHQLGAREILQADATDPRVLSAPPPAAALLRFTQEHPNRGE